MGQSSQVAGTTGTRRLLRALRPIVLLGGFVVVWWCLATGTAQADTGSEHDTRVTRVLARTADRVVDQRAHRTVDRVRHSGHMSPRTVGRTVRHQAAPVAAPVSTTVQRTLVKPIMAGITHVARPPVTKGAEADPFDPRQGSRRSARPRGLGQRCWGPAVDRRILNPARGNGTLEAASTGPVRRYRRCPPEPRTDLPNDHPGHWFRGRRQHRSGHPRLPSRGPAARPGSRVLRDRRGLLSPVRFRPGRRRWRDRERAAHPAAHCGDDEFHARRPAACRADVSAFLLA
jgi:hypothetical protein